MDLMQVLNAANTSRRRLLTTMAERSGQDSALSADLPQAAQPGFNNVPVIAFGHRSFLNRAQPRAVMRQTADSDPRAN